MDEKISARLIFAIFSTLLEEILLAVAVLWGLPYLGIHIPIAGLVVLMVALATYAVISYRVVSRSLKKKPIVGLPAMIGSKAKVVSPLAPEGLVKIRDELWKAKSAGTKIDAGEEVTVVGQDGLELIVHKNSNSDLKETK